MSDTSERLARIERVIDGQQAAQNRLPRPPGRQSTSGLARSLEEERRAKAEARREAAEREARVRAVVMERRHVELRAFARARRDVQDAVVAEEKRHAQALQRLDVLGRAAAADEAELHRRIEQNVQRELCR